MSIEQQPDYALLVSTPDEFGRVTVHSPQVPGLVLHGQPSEVLSDAAAAVKLLRELNGANK